MFGLGVTELSIILVIALVIFGGSKLRTLGGDVGGAISEFKKSVTDEDEDEKKESTSAPSTSAPAAATPEEKPAE